MTASGALVAISKLKPGQKVLATNTTTGKTQAEPVAAVLVHYDTDLYDLKVRTTSGTAVIHTTRSHLFWNQTTHRWTKAAALKYGTHLRTPSGGSAAVVGGWTPKVTTGWMWDLTIPGNNDHDFYIQTSASAVLVHNVNPGDGCDAADAADLQQRADDLQSRMPARTARSTTTAALRAYDASGAARTIVATSENTFRAGWLAAVRGDEIAVAGPDDAEMNAINVARMLGLRADRIAASRPVCIGCAATLRGQGVDIVSPLREYPALGFFPNG